MEIHQLEYVLAVEKFRHFSRAAEEICISQSTLSQQIRKLEEELGIPLFERTTRNVHPTSAGKEFIVYAKRIMGEIERARQAMLEHNSLGRGKLVIGAIPIIGYLGITSAIAKFQKTYPGIELEIKEAGSDLLSKWLHETEIDVAFLTYRGQAGGIDFSPLMEDEIVLITDHSHPLAQRKRIHLREAYGEKFLAIKSSSAMRSICEQACLAVGFQPTIIFESSQVETIIGMVEEGVGVALMTLRVAQYIPHTRISIIRLHQTLTRTTAIATPRQPHLPAATNAFRKFVLQHFA